MASFDKKLYSILVKSKTLSQEDAERLLGVAVREKTGLSSVIIKEGILGREELLGIIGIHANIPPIDLDHVHINKELAEILPEEVARSYKVFPLDRIGDYLSLCVTNPFDILKLDDIRIITGCELRPVLALEEQVEAKLDQLYKSDTEAIGEMLEGFDDQDVELKEKPEDTSDMDLAAANDDAAPVVKLINKIISDAVTQGVSDIHIEPFEKTILVRFRKDGGLVEILRPPKRFQNSMASRLKIMAKLDIAEKRKPQDGKFQMRMGKKAIDFRVSTLPTVWGEKVVLRILDSSNLALDIKTLGFEDKCLDDYLWACSRPFGMILVTGPTGSGKSTTLYSALSHIHEPDVNIVTVEDPVEYTMMGINQVPVNPTAGLTFAAALRSILRQDPDIILLGEIRDKETIEIAVKAALTGHLVLSTLHTNDAPSTITRMVDMGLDPFMVASSTLVICAQRLAKRLCKNCKEETEVPLERLYELGLPKEDLELFDGVQLYKASEKGCPKCNRGYKGRFALLETLRLTEPIRRLIVQEANVMDIKKQAVGEGMLTLRRCGLRNALRGVTSLEEVIRVTMAD
ncbi:MAG TPA: type IV-A pilus assembly ATPase PilB [Planctomycetes bacterium]|nr:type IV-A pilus assembly ATPase PilB [Planctomycetota bacterium]